jgi:predicted RNA polymerase sigma factor
VARDSYGRLVAYLAARTNSIASAEDALSDALHSALLRWPIDGVPQRPEAWLMTTARRKLIDAGRHNQVHARAETALQILAEASAMTSEAATFPDERLKLLFVCAHPAVDRAVRTPLMLQTVLGLNAQKIASAFLVSPATMGQRLVRAKQKISEAGIPFVVPDPREWDERVSCVLAALYSAYTTGWDSHNDVDSVHRALAGEAVALARILVQLMPDEPEAQGLLALMLHCEARADARFEGGKFLPLDEQDTGRWSKPLMQEAEAALRLAAAKGRPGRFQLEAAIQSVHASRMGGHAVDWPHIVVLYEHLSEIAPSTGARVSQAVAIAKAGRPDVAFAELSEIPAQNVGEYQPFWAARAYILKILGRPDEARNALTRAIGLTEDPALREFLTGQMP